MTIEVKLVIWDLDNTLWRGTLAEGDTPVLLPERAELIKKMTSVGIVNSICSKNNFDDAKRVLTDMGLWDYFVFPKINFAPKGQMIKSILDEMHLRAVNTVFIDDEVSNLQEVLYYNPGINVVKENFCENFFATVKFVGNNDLEHSRLKQYKQLERKQQEKKSFSSNEDFLRSSNIRLSFVSVTTPELFKRLYELTERTNQLNFTKNRMKPSELLTLLENDNVETRMIHATDNFGDYGFIGFYSLYQRNLIHFVFSCRVINMGIEHFVYQYLGYPKIKVKGDTASHLSRDNSRIDYIKVVNGNAGNYEEESVERVLTEESQINIFALGACDLFHAVTHLALPNNYLIYECNVFTSNERGVNVGTEYIRSQYDMTDDEKNFCRHHFYNYTRYNVFKSDIFNDAWDYVILSFHDDMIYKVYEKKDNPNLRIVFSPDKRFGDTSVINIFGKETATYEEQRAWLAENFNEGHYITPERFEENLLWIASHLPEKTKIILINGPVYDFFREKFPHCPEAREQIIALNKVIARVCETHSDKFSLVDMNKVVRSKNDVTNYIFHLKALTAFNLFAEIATVMQKSPPTHKPPMLHKVLNGRKVCVFGKNVFELSNACYDLLLGNEKISAFVYHKLDKIEDSNLISDLNIIDFKNYAFQRDKYYILVADNDNYKEIRAVLIENGYEPVKDFVQFKPVEYKKTHLNLPH